MSTPVRPGVTATSIAVGAIVRAPGPFSSRFPPDFTRLLAPSPSVKEEVQAYQLLARAGRLPVRVHMLIRVIESNFGKHSLFFFNDTATTEIYTLSLHDALPI